MKPESKRSISQKAYKVRLCKYHRLETSFTCIDTWESFCRKCPKGLQKQALLHADADAVSEEENKEELEKLKPTPEAALIAREKLQELDDTLLFTREGILLFRHITNAVLKHNLTRTMFYLMALCKQPAAVLDCYHLKQKMRKAFCLNEDDEASNTDDKYSIMEAEIRDAVLCRTVYM